MGFGDNKRNTGVGERVNEGSMRVYAYEFQHGGRSRGEREREQEHMGWKSTVDDRGQRFSRMVRWLVAGAPHMGTQEY